MLLSEKCTSIIQISNILLLISGIITSSVGASMIPQTITNNGSVYVGSAEEHQADLQALQFSSYGFKVTMAGLIIVGYSIIGSGCIYCYTSIDCRSNIIKVQQAPIVQAEPKPLKSILKDTHAFNLQMKIKKWSGNTKLEDIV
jgi:hypothetical protein